MWQSGSRYSSQWRLGWFLGPLDFALATTGVVIVMWRRQYTSEPRRAFEKER
jgi:uncharacterized membrane protein